MPQKPIQDMEKKVQMPDFRHMTRKEKLELFEIAAKYISTHEGANVQFTMLIGDKLLDEVKAHARGTNVSPAEFIRNSVRSYLGARNVLHLLSTKGEPYVE